MINWSKWNRFRKIGSTNPGSMAFSSQINPKLNWMLQYAALMLLWLLLCYRWSVRNIQIIRWFHSIFFSPSLSLSYNLCVKLYAIWKLFELEFKCAIIITNKSILHSETEKVDRYRIIKPYRNHYWTDILNFFFKELKKKKSNTIK